MLTLSVLTIMTMTIGKLFFHFSCRAFNAPFYIGVVVPFLAVYLFNWVIFFIIIISLLRKKFQSKLNTKKNTKSKTVFKQQLMIVITLSTLFGLGWGLGLLVTENIYNNKTVRDLIAALFVIFTAFHGLFIFLIYCLRSKDAQSVWKNVVVTGKNFSEFSLNRVNGKTLSTRLQSQTNKSQRYAFTGGTLKYGKNSQVALCASTKKGEVEHEKELTAVRVDDDDIAIQETSLNFEKDGQNTLRFYARKTEDYGPQFDILNKAVEIPMKSMTGYRGSFVPYDAAMNKEPTAVKPFSDDKKNEKRRRWRKEETKA